jgi:hypothetical protein
MANVEDLRKRLRTSSRQSLKVRLCGTPVTKRERAQSSGDARELLLLLGLFEGGNTGFYDYNGSFGTMPTFNFKFLSAAFVI